MVERLIPMRVLMSVDAVCLALGGLAVLMSVIGCGGDDPPADPMTRGATVASPAVEGPVSGGSGAPFIASTAFDLKQVGYQQAEYFISGTATAYTNVGALGTDGLWTVAPGETAQYKTRILVYRPIDAKTFNGTVVVEWLNVSGGLDAAPDWLSAHTELIRSGYAWVGVSAQRTGVEGGGSVVGLTSMPLKEVDPQRYGSLVHPGDSFSYDIYSQAAQAVRRPTGIPPLGNLRVSRLIAAGESQSAFRLVTYINAVHPRDDIYDGFLVHSRGGSTIVALAPLAETPQRRIPVPGTVAIRADLNVPTLTFQTETDLILLDSRSARQPDSDRFRLWEVAGTAHADLYTVVGGSNDLGNSPDAARVVENSMPIPQISCEAPLNSGPQHFVLNAAFKALHDWVRNGTLPPRAPWLEVTGSPPAIVRDEHGNARGGIRTPYVDVPIATLSGEGQTGSVLCVLFGTTSLFDSAKLAMLYPTQAAYVDAYNAATDAAVAAGFILPADAELMKAAAATTEVGS
jgi:hypothetical protein